MPARDLYADMVKQNREDDAKHIRTMGYLYLLNAVLFIVMFMIYFFY